MLTMLGAKLREEVDDYWNNQKHENSISFQDAQAMPYLQACIKEAMRLHPATGLPLARVVPRGGATINDIYFPEKVILSWFSSLTNEADARS